jgi:hypothetical protein
MKFVMLAAAALSVAGGAAHAQDYGRPPYASNAYAGYDGGGCGGFTIVGVHAGVTVLGIDVGAGGRARIGGDCRSGYTGGAAYAPAPVYQGQGYSGQGYQAQGYQTYPVQGYGDQGGYYNEPAYAAPASYPMSVYPQQLGYGYAPQSYGYAQPY